MPRTMLDVTRLITRAGHPVATGVDRVELAYARRLLAEPAERTGFAAILGSRAVPMPRERVAAFVEALGARWGSGRGDPAAARRLAERLGAPPPKAEHEGEVAADDAARRLATRLRLDAIVGLRTAAVGPGDAYVHVSHIRLDRPAVFAGVRAAGARLVAMVHDLIPIRFPEYGRAGEAERHATRMTTALDRANLLLANSADTARDLAAFAAETGRRPPDVLVAPLGIETAFAPGAPLEASKPYFVALGTIEPRKNHLLLLHVWRRLAETLGEATPALVLVGRRGWENEMVVDLLERCPAIRAHVVETNALSDASLVALLRGARALLFPSFAEGYGLPLAEALTLGLPTIASDLPAFREIAGDRVAWLDPLDGPGWEAAVRACLPEPAPYREAALARAAGYATPTWDEHFALVDAAIGLENPSKS